MMTIKGKDTVTIIRRGYTGQLDDYGNSIPQEVQIPVKNVLIAYGPTADMITTTSESISHAATLYLSQSITVKKDDRFKLSDGSIWTLNGAPINWNAPANFRVKPRQIVEITRTEG